MADLKERWGAMSDSERYDLVVELQRVQSGVDRKVHELAEQEEHRKAEVVGRDKKIDELTREVERLKESSGQAIGAIEGLQAEAAAVAAQKALNEQTANMLQRGVEEKIDPKLAVEFATLSDPNGAFDRALAEISRRASEKVDEIISQAGAPESSPSKTTTLDLSQFSAEEISRMPDDVVRKYMTTVVESEVMHG